MLYTVTKESNDGTFLVGDVIQFEKDGSIGSVTAQRWIDKKDVSFAMIGMQFENNTQYNTTEIETLKNKIKSLENLV
jgi:hypothetical protein